MLASIAEVVSSTAGVEPARQREVLVLRLAVGVSAEETAEAVGSTPGAVRVTQHRALLRLRRIIARGASTAASVADLDGGDAESGEEPSI